MQWIKVDGDLLLIGKGELTLQRDFPTGRLKGKSKQRDKLKAARLAAERETARMKTQKYSQGKLIQREPKK